MPYHDRDLRRDASDSNIERGSRPDPTLRATPRQAAWSWVATAAIVFILGVVFYGINAHRTPQGGGPVVTASPAPTASAGPAESTGQGERSQQAPRQPPAGNDSAR
jgi:hypothetical protein